MEYQSYNTVQKTDYNPDYKVEHLDGKGRVGDFLKAQPSAVSDNGMTWSAVTTGPYMDMLNMVSIIAGCLVFRANYPWYLC